MTLVDIDAEPRFAHLLDKRVEFDQAQIFPTPTETRMTFVINRGRAEGARIAGDILAGGGDWVVLGSDGAYIHLTVTGRMLMGPEVHYKGVRGSLSARPST